MGDYTLAISPLPSRLDGMFSTVVMWSSVLRAVQNSNNTVSKTSRSQGMTFATFWAGLRWPALQEHHFNKHGLPQGGPAPLFHSNDSTIPLPFLLGRHCDARDFATQGTCRDVGLKKRWSTKCNIEKYQKSQRNDGIKTYIMIKFLIIVYHLTNTASEKPTRCKTSIAETNNSLEMLRI